MPGFNNVELAPPNIIPLGVKIYVAVRSGDGAVFADMCTASFNKEETQLKTEIENIQLPSWNENHPVVVYGSFILAEAFLEE